MSGLLAASCLCAGYGQLMVVRDLSLTVNPGEIVALFGPNGAGKTTTLRTLSGELRPLGGSVQWEGRVITAPPHRRARLGLAVVSEERTVFRRLSAADNLRVARVTIPAAIGLFPELEPLLSVKAGDLSGGEQQMLSLARALGRSPRMLLVDELSLGLAPMIVGRLLAAIREAADLGVGILLVEQQVQQALRICDRAYVLRKGLLEMTGTAAEVSRHIDELTSSYLGHRTPSPGRDGSAPLGGS